ncbi:hypothetical protein [Vitiosangium sp. GDMCC 1.1324]|uniref:hypothetical protein n=1 Tax=Vitiosangium sp. (strain GDMCC 1.1324) TaxID=2138576 RepID=UPI000D37E781|nr:hypothetical protein [Vitiosangium sp. GDMCC 1.1324]PTL79154.1 hypothetical protein DAT35_36775 [Vitiosangium sp. GDMCC 1.1324]
MVERRNAIWARYESERQTLDSTALRQLSASVAAQLRGLDMEIEAGLQDAQAQGCLGLTSGMRCDWSPERFKVLIDAEMVPRRETNFQRCLEITGNDFGAQSFVRNAGQLGISGLEGDYTTGARKLDSYIASYKRWLDGQPTIMTAWTQKIRRSFKKSDSGGFGDSDAGASYEYGAGWEFNATASHLGVCEAFDSHANAYLRARAQLFGSDNEIFYASGDATAQDKSTNTGDENVGYAVVLRVVGSDIYKSSGNYPATFSFANSKSAKQEFLKVSIPIPIMGIPITVSGSIIGSVGINAGVHGGVSPGCRFTLGSNVMPWAKVDAAVAVAVDVWFASAGISGSLTLIGAEVPVNVELAVFLDSLTSQVMFKSDAELAVTLRALDGSIKLFLDVILLDPAEVVLFEFTGSKSTMKLEEHKKVPLGLLL